MQIKIVELDISADHDLRIPIRTGLRWTAVPVGSLVYTQFSACLTCHSSSYAVWVRVQYIMNVFYF